MHIPTWLSDSAKLIGILIVLVGFALKLKPTVVVVAAAIVTGLIARIPLFSSDPRAEGLIDMLGRAFVENRMMTLFIITLPAIGLSERFGLQQRAAELIRSFRAATVARLLIAYQLFRVCMGILGLRVNGHATFVRPLVFPMARGAIAGRSDESEIEKLKAASAASENYGNFYGQNLSPVQPGVLLVYSQLTALGCDVSVWRLVLFAIPIASLTLLVGGVQFWIFGRLIRSRTRFREGEDAPAMVGEPE
jgi:uncharacterized membrane protein